VPRPRTTAAAAAVAAAAAARTGRWRRDRDVRRCSAGPRWPRLDATAPASVAARRRPSASPSRSAAHPGAEASEGAAPGRLPDVSDLPAAVDEPGAALLRLYDDALPSVYGYLIARCGQVALAQDLTAET